MLDRIFNPRIKGMLTALFAGALIPGGQACGLPEATSIFLGIGVAAAIDIALRFNNRRFEEPMIEPQAGGTFMEFPVWICCILTSAIVVGIYSGWLN